MISLSSWVSLVEPKERDHVKKSPAVRKRDVRV